MNRKLNNGDPDAVVGALGDHFNSLLLPQDKVSDTRHVALGGADRYCSDRRRLLQ
jgi:hypothetical protein